MTLVRHEVPTHLDVEDKVLLGLTVRQFLYLLVGSSASYALWQQLVGLADPWRSASALVCAGLTVAFALFRPGGRALEEWLAAGLVFMASPRQAVWQPCQPVLADWRPEGATWQELAPSPVWTDEADPT